MRRSALLVLTVALIAAEAPKGADAEKELKRLDGTWTMVSGEEKGKSLPEDTIKKAKLTLKGDKHTVVVGDDTIIGTHKVDPTKKPKAIDATDTEGPYKGNTVRGIYKLEKGEFTVCFAPPGKDRPTEFTTKAGTGEILHVWKRQKK